MPDFSKPPSSGGGSPFSRPPSPTRLPRPAKPKRHGGLLGGVLGGVKNAAGDVAGIATGVVPSLYTTGKNLYLDLEQGTPKRSVAMGKALAKSYADTYGPLAHGDWRTFLDNVYQHPVYVALDAATLASLGVGSAVKVGIIPARGGRILELTDETGKVVARKPLARGEMRAQLQALTAQASQKGLPLRPPGVTAAKVERARIGIKAANTQAIARPFDRELAKLRGKPARVATFLRARFDREALNQEIARLRDQAAKDGPRSPAAKTLAIITNQKTQRLFDQPTAQMGKVIEEAGALGEKQSAMLGVNPATAEAARYRPARIAGGARMVEKKLEGGPSIEELQARGLNPTYLPDTQQAASRTVREIVTGRGGGVGVPKLPGNTRFNTGSLQLAGRLVMDPAVLNRSFLNAAKYQHYADIHESLLNLAKPSETIPKGYTLIRKKRSERVPGTEKGAADFNEWAAAHLDENGAWKRGENGLTTTDVADAATDAQGRYLVVPNGVARTLAGEFTRQNRLFYWVNRYPMRVWRALVLGLRPAYLVNNVVGNTLMYLVHSARPEDLRQLAGAFKQFAKPSEGKQIDALLEKHFAGQVHGGFTATQYPELRPRRLPARAASAVVGFIPKLDRRWEQALRRAKVKAELRRHPQLRDIAERMGTETDYFERIGPVLDQQPDIARQVYERVNDALGNYDHMSAFEQGTMRNLFPFYAWYKAIAGVSAKLAIEQPLKVTLLARLGQIATDQNLAAAGLNRQDAPTSLLGFLPSRIEGNRVRGFNTSGLNPYATVGQLADFASSPLKGAGAMGRTLPGANPLLTDLLSFVFGRTPGGYRTPDVPGVGTIESLPQARLLAALKASGVNVPVVPAAPTGDTYNDRDPLDELLRYLGVPYARVSPTAAKRVAGR